MTEPRKRLFPPRNGLEACLDKFGHISVHVDIGGGPEAAKRETGASAPPAMVAAFLFDLADDIQRLANTVSNIDNKPQA